VADYISHEAVHLAENGIELGRTAVLYNPSHLCVNPMDGSCWVVASKHVVHLAHDTSELARVEPFYYPKGISVNPLDGSCWIADTGNSQVVRLLVMQLWFEDDDARIIYTGTWSELSHAAASAGHLKYSDETDATAELTFEGTGARWMLAVGPMAGKADVYLDGGYVVTVDLYRPSLRLLTLEKTGLAPGAHTGRIEVSGTKNPSSSNYYVDIDAFEVVP